MIISGKTIRPFVVTLQELPEKERFIMDHFHSVGMEAECFNGMHGATSGLKTVFPYEVDSPGSGWNIGIKPVATWISFYMLWSAMRYMPEPYFWQLEWDCKFDIDWKPRLEAALNDVPQDFDMLMVGSCCANNVSNKRHIKGNVWDVRYPLCGHCTIIAAKAIPVMLATQRKVYAPLDISLAFHTMPKLKIYTVLPRLAGQFDTIIPP